MQSLRLFATLFVTAFLLIGCNRTSQGAKQEGPPVPPVPQKVQPVSTDYRTWTLKTGEIEARFRGVNTTNTNGITTTTVTLQKADGQTLSVLMADLPKPDQDSIQAYVESRKERFEAGRSPERQAEFEKRRTENQAEMEKRRIENQTMMKERQAKWNAARKEEEEKREAEWAETLAKQAEERTQSPKTADKTEPRTWTDRSGSFTVEALLVSFDGNTVQLKKEDGKIVSLALDKLSEADKRFLTRDVSSTKPTKVTGPTAVRTQGTSSAVATVKTVHFKNAKEVGHYGERRWSCPPDPSPVVLPSKNISFYMDDIPFRSKDCNFFFSRNGRKVLYAIQITTEGDESTRIFLGDVASGAVTMASNPLCLTPYGLSPDGSKAMFLQTPWEFGIHSGQKGKIHIMKCDSDRPEPFVILNPIENWNPRGKQTTADVEEAVWASNNHILVHYFIGSDRMLVLVDINTGQALWRLKPSGMKALTLSPGGKYFLVRAEKATHLLETASGKTIGTLEGVNELYSFSPNGQKIAACGDHGETVQIWNATTGELEETFFANPPDSRSQTKFTWVGNQHLFINNRLIDTFLPATIWEYKVHAGFIDDVSYFGGQFWYMMRGRQILVGIELPQKEVFDRFSENQNDSDLFIVQPGMTVTLKIDPSLNRDQEEIRRSIEEKLRNNGLTLANNAPVTFLLKVTQGEERTTVYRGIGRGETEVKYWPKIYHALAQQDSQTFWQRTYRTSPPFMASDTEDLPLQEYVTKKMQEMHYKDWFLQLVIPQKIPRADNLDKSTFDEQGLRDD